MADNMFQITYEVDDGYCGGARPQHCSVADFALEEDMTEEDIRRHFRETVEEDFRERISWSSDDEDDFVEWAKARIASRG